MHRTPAGSIHLVNDMPYARALCGELIGQENWTDAVIEVVTDLDNVEQSHYCVPCLKAAKMVVAELDREQAREIAREEGMLNGIASSNDWREALHA